MEFPTYDFGNLPTLEQRGLETRPKQHGNFFHMQFEIQTHWGNLRRKYRIGLRMVTHANCAVKKNIYIYIYIYNNQPFRVCTGIIPEFRCGVTTSHKLFQPASGEGSLFH